MITQATIKAIQDVMRKDVGVDGDAQRLGQLVWMVFLKVLDDHELECEVLDSGYRSPLPDHLRWRAWAGEDEGVTGDTLLNFITEELFPGLSSLPQYAGDRAAMAGVVRSVFSDAHNYMKSGTLLRQVLNLLQRDLDYNSSEDRHTFGDIYENLLRGLQSAGDAGEYYTPRAVTEFMVEMVNPQLGEVVLDPACGTGGFLLCALNHLRDQHVDSVDDDRIAQQSIRAVEKKPLPHLLCVTNMLLHGVDVPVNIRRGNTLARPLLEYGPADQVDIVVTNPPFRGMEEDGIEKNFPPGLRTRETADLFLLLVLRVLRDTGRAAIVLPDSLLFEDGVREQLRKKLLTEANLHTIVRLPSGVFSPYTDIRTNLLFFDKGRKTSEIWYYELNPPVGDKFTKTKPIRHEHFDAAREWWSNRAESESAWRVSVDTISAPRYHLALTNPSRSDSSKALLRARESLDQCRQDLAHFRAMLGDMLSEAPTRIGPRARRLVEDVADLASSVPLTSGVVEDLRAALTGLALRGDLSEPLTGDESVADTIARYMPSQRRQIESRVPQPFDIPQHWRWCSLAEISEFVVGRTPSTHNHKYWIDNSRAEGHPWVAISDMPRRGSVVETKKRITDLAVTEVFHGQSIPAGSLLMAFKLSLGKTAIAGLDCYHNEAIASFGIRNATLREFLLWSLPALAKVAASNPAVRGSTLNSKSVSAMWVPIPPEQEQVRILESLKWITTTLEEVADQGEEARAAADRVLKLTVTVGASHGDGAS